ncbi:YafY family protein [Schumannella sp. 10F1B-5-1]|uniref:helix-turn-helix transcriptional regulator n=1 Tax=Schumannella sp. 10F1B-5-1 TaxID=2590780 RepID=UPI001130244A|nr:WYL domain-containing protein [Schumannella sp. 10F1B-5-1]TPW70921.1 WYL domain-containing protein [Schumannella sp. 10F1B-5-1]
MPRRKADAPSAPKFSARDRLAFLLALVPWLMDHERVTVDEAAAHFDVDADLVRESVELIAVSGVPGDTSSYQHGDLFDIAWDAFEERGEIVLTNLVAIDDAPRFSAREAAALIAGLQYLSSLPETADSAAIATLMGKLSRGTSGQVAPVGVAGVAGDATLATIRDAVARGVQLELDYLNSRGESERRRVDPLRIDSNDTDWYLRGWCHLRQAVRTFRLDRMSDVVVTDRPIEHGVDEVALPDKLFEGASTELVATIDVAAAALPLLADYLPDDAPRSQHGDLVRLELPISHLEVLTRLISGMPGVATVVGPPEARTAVAAWAHRALARYDEV